VEGWQNDENIENNIDYHCRNSYSVWSDLSLIPDPQLGFSTLHQGAHPHDY
jgi:hypothetical protein